MELAGDESTSPVALVSLRPSHQSAITDAESNSLAELTVNGNGNHRASPTPTKHPQTTLFCRVPKLLHQ
nr:hypothetical protein Itr_chr14CG10540 [Ipomoea trifida]